MLKSSFVKVVMIFFIYLTSLCPAQTRIGGKVGVSLEKLSGSSDNIYSQDYSSKSAIDFGFLAEFPISKEFSIQPEILLATRGGIRTGMQPIQPEPLAAALESNGINMELLNLIIVASGGEPLSDENPLYADYTSEADLNYLEIPILAKFCWGDEWRFFALGGPYFGYLLKSSQITSGTSQIYLDSDGNQPLQVPNPLYDPNNPENQPQFIELPPRSFEAVTDTKDNLNSLNFGIHAGLGIAKRLGNKHEIFLDVRASYGLIPIQKDETFGQSKIGAVAFSFGYSYALGESKN